MERSRERVQTRRRRRQGDKVLHRANIEEEIKYLIQSSDSTDDDDTDGSCGKKWRTKNKERVDNSSRSSDSGDDCVLPTSRIQKVKDLKHQNQRLEESSSFLRKSEEVSELSLASDSFEITERAGGSMSNPENVSSTKEVTSHRSDDDSSGSSPSPEVSTVTGMEMIELPQNRSPDRNIAITFRSSILEETIDPEVESGDELNDDAVETIQLSAAVILDDAPTEVPRRPGSSPLTTDDDIDEDKADDKLTLLQELATWAVKKYVSHAAVDDLLGILRLHGHPELPKNAKTLLATPRKTKDVIKEFCGGEYWYGGIVNGIKSRLTRKDFERNQGKPITIDIFVDGISPYKSIRKNLVAVAGCVAGQKKPFEIVLWCGRIHDPDNVQQFFQDFVNEMKELQETGFVIDRLHGAFFVVIRRVVGDALARAWLLQNVMPPQAFYCCERCCIKGRRTCYRTLFDPSEEATLRTDETLASQSQVEHHIGVCPLLEIGLKLLSQFPIEPMHCVYLGVERRFLQFLFQSKKRVSKISVKPAVLDDLSESLVSLKSYYVSEFNRQLRPLLEWTTYKASELRRLCLYDCFYLLPQLENEKIAKVHNLLACAIRILEDKDLVETFRPDADRLLKNFIVASTQMFGEFFPTFNIHCLSHLADDAARHGILMDFSAWKYESYLGQVKKTLRAPGRTLQQIVRRLLEKRSTLSADDASVIDADAIRVSRPHFRGPLVQRCDEQFQHLSVRNLGVFRTASANDVCFVSSAGEICVVRNITRNKGDIQVVCNAFVEKEEYFTYPFSSLALGICKVQKVGPLKTLPVSAMKHKAVLLPLRTSDILSDPTSQWMNNVQCVCLPMLHHPHDLSEMTD